MKAVSLGIDADDWNVIIRIGVDIASFVRKDVTIWQVATPKDLPVDQQNQNVDFSVYLDGMTLCIVVALNKKFLKLMVTKGFSWLWHKIRGEHSGYSQFSGIKRVLGANNDREIARLGV
jgi:hypothetical protein